MTIFYCKVISNIYLDHRGLFNFSETAAFKYSWFSKSSVISLLLGNCTHYDIAASSKPYLLNLSNYSHCYWLLRLPLKTLLKQCPSQLSHHSDTMPLEFHQTWWILHLQMNKKQECHSIWHSLSPRCQFYAVKWMYNEIPAPQINTNGFSKDCWWT